MGLLTKDEYDSIAAHLDFPTGAFIDGGYRPAISGQVFETVNPATETLFGYPAEELIGANVNILMPSPYQAEHDGYLRNYLQSGMRKVIGIGREIVAKKKDGSVFPIHLAVSDIRVGDRRLWG